MYPGVEEPLPIAQEKDSARLLLKIVGVRPFQEDDGWRQDFTCRKTQLVAIGDFQQRGGGNDVGLAVRHAKAEAAQVGMDPHHAPQQPRRHQPRRRLDRPHGVLQLRQRQPRIARSVRRAVRARRVARSRAAGRRGNFHAIFKGICTGGFSD